MCKPRDIEQFLFSRASAVVPFARRERLLPVLAGFLLLPTVYAQHTPTNTTTQVLGIGTAALIGGDLTDPDNNGLDAAGAATDPHVGLGID